MSKEFILFDNEEMSFKMKFYRLMDLLVSNKSSTRMECVIFFGIFYIQSLVGFFDVDIGVMEIETSFSDNVLNYVYKIIRIKGLLMGNYPGFSIVIYILFGLALKITLNFFLLLLRISKNTFYTNKEFLMNFLIKVFLFVAFNPILDLTLSNLCFSTKNPNFPSVTCNWSDNITVYVVSLLLLLYSIFLTFFINMYYNDSYFLSNSYYSRMNCGYEMYMTLHSIIYAVLLSQAQYIGNYIFLIYNFIVALIFLKFFFTKYFFYDKISNMIVGTFHILFTWTALFSLIFSFISMNEKGIIYLIGCVIVLFLYYNLKYKLEESIILKTPFHKITNKYHLLFYLKSIIDKIHNLDSSIETRAELVGIIQNHQIECPSPDCLTKRKEKKIYLPVTEEWSLRDKDEINDKVFLLNFIIILVDYFITQSYYSPEMLINLSLYYLTIIGNHCQAMFYYKKVKEMKLSLQENFAFIRLNFAISKSLIEKLRPSNEGAPNLEDLDTTLYFKYEDLSQKFFDEINNDINLSLEFWRTFKAHHQRRTLDFNKIFHLTDKIRLTKNKIEKTWNSLFATFPGVNDLFELYEDYIEQINDDDMLKRELEGIKNKMINMTDHIQINYYNLLFNKETGIVIANGDKSKEGIIEKTNDEIEKIFEYKCDELKGMNISYLMPRLFERHHKNFMERYFDIGEKRRIDKQFKSFAKDRENCLLPVKLYIKLFPMLNDNIYYCSMVVRENLDDVILIDSKFNIQGISKKLVAKFELDNKNLFNDCDIPFYIICKKFINFYKTFLKANNRKNKKDSKKNNKGNMISNNPGNQVQVASNLTPYFENNLELASSDNETFKGTSGFGTTGGRNKEGPVKVIEPNLMISSINNNIDAINNQNFDDNLNNLNIENIEINENTELEYEITIPHFLQQYVSTINRRENKMDIKLLKTNTLESTHQDNDQTNDDYEEDDNLVHETKEAPTQNESPRKNFNKQSDEEKEFQSKIKQYRTLFETGKYNELVEIITKLNNENQTREYKFNFTFDKYRFGDGNLAYVIRCIDNKNEYEEVETMSIGGNQAEKEKHTRQQKAKIDALKDLNEVTADERVEILDRSADYLKLCVDDREFAKTLSGFKDEIAIYSKIFGVKNEDTQLDDENSSQSSQAGFNDNIARKSRIEEIRSNIMQNVANFHLLKWIKAVFYIIIITTAAFCGLYLMIFDIIYQDLNNISELNIGLFQSTIWMCNTISTLISLRSLYQLNLNHSSINYNSYITPAQLYFYTLQNYSVDWYNSIISNSGPIEYKINLYFAASDTIDFWTQMNVSYPIRSGVIDDTGSLPMTLSQVLSAVNELINNPDFDLLTNAEASKVSAHTEDLIDYAGYMIIENGIMNLLPRQFSVLNKAPGDFMVLNQNNMNYVIIIMVAYVFFILILVGIYAIILYLTNKNMEEGLEKVTKIKSDKIEETIKRIETFNEKCLSKYRQKDSKIHDDRDFKLESNTNTSLANENHYSIIGEAKNYKSLKILSYSYFQIAEIILIFCAFLLPIYFISQDMIQSSNEIISVQNFIFGKSLTASASTVNIKCVIAECDLQWKNINYTFDFVQSSQVETIVRDISNFPELNDFYSNKYLLNACAVLYNTTNPKYASCMSDVYIKSANNTDSLLKLVAETVSTIQKDREMKLNLPYKLSNGTTVTFQDTFLFETTYFRDLEYIFYNYITPVSDNFSNVVSLTLNNYVLNERVKIIILISVFGTIVLIFSFYIAHIFTKTLIHLLSVSRCILRIIPTSVINSTQELEIWIENKY